MWVDYSIKHKQWYQIFWVDSQIDMQNLIKFDEKRFAVCNKQFLTSTQSIVKSMHITSQI